MSGKHLFSKIAWYLFAESAKRDLKDKLDAVPEGAIKTDAAAVGAQLFSLICVRVPTVFWDKADATSQEVDIDLSGVPNTMAWVTRQRVLKKGIQFEVSVPFDGDADLFDVQPQSYTMNPPFAIVGHASLSFAYSGLQPDIEGWMGNFEESKRNIETYLTSLRQSAEALNREFESIIQAGFQARRTKLEQASADLDAFRARLKGASSGR